MIPSTQQSGTIGRSDEKNSQPFTPGYQTKMPPADQPRSANSSHCLRYWLDGLLVASMVAAASVFACQELNDTDSWWHLRSGQWILENCRLPTLDPFSFASADREWIDLHWGFQIPLALAYRLGGVAGMILLTSAMCGVTLLIAMTARMRDWPAWVVAAAWVPALLVMSTRLPPRPEVFSLAFLAAYMAVLLRCDRRPVFVWVLPVIQVLWVNSHGLFILGPIILAAYVADGALRTLRGAPGRLGAGRSDRSSLVDARRARLGRCRGHLLRQPLRSTRGAVPPGAFPQDRPSGGDLQGEHRRVLLPLQVPPGRRVLDCVEKPGRERRIFLAVDAADKLPGTRHLGDLDRGRACEGAMRPDFASRWLLGMAVAVGLVIFATFCLPLAGTPAGRIQAGRWAPAGFLALGFVVAAVVVWRSPLAALLSACGGVAFAGGLPWFQAAMVGHKPGAAGLFDIRQIGWPWVAGPAAAAVLFLTLRAAGGCSTSSWRSPSAIWPFRRFATRPSSAPWPGSCSHPGWANGWRRSSPRTRRRRAGGRSGGDWRLGS